MFRARLFASIVAVATVAGTTTPVAYAQRAPKAERERAAKARVAYDDGKKAYNLGEFDRAVELWKQGYEYKDDPIFLFNIGQAYRQNGDHQKALFFYRAYLREDPRARNRDDVEARIAELGKLMEAQQNAVESPPSEPVTPTVDPEPAPTEPAPSQPPPEAPLIRDEGSRPGRGLKIGGIVAGGAGVAAVATGVVFLLRSSSIEGELEEAAASGMPWTSDLMDRESQGKSAQTIGFIAVGVGAACLITGATLFTMGARKDAAARREVQARWQLAPTVSPDTVGVSVSLIGW